MKKFEQESENDNDQINSSFTSIFDQTDMSKLTYRQQQLVKGYRENKDKINPLFKIKHNITEDSKEDKCCAKNTAVKPKVEYIPNFTEIKVNDVKVVDEKEVEKLVVERKVQEEKKVYNKIDTSITNLDSLLETEKVIIEEIKRESIEERGRDFEKVFEEPTVILENSNFNAEIEKGTNLLVEKEVTNDAFDLKDVGLSKRGDMEQDQIVFYANHNENKLSPLNIFKTNFKEEIVGASKKLFAEEQKGNENVVKTDYSINENKKTIETVAKSIEKIEKICFCLEKAKKYMKFVKWLEKQRKLKFEVQRVLKRLEKCENGCQCKTLVKTFQYLTELCEEYDKKLKL